MPGDDGSDFAGDVDDVGMAAGGDGEVVGYYFHDEDILFIVKNELYGYAVKSAMSFDCYRWVSSEA